MFIPGTDGRLQYQGAVSVETLDSGAVRAWRIHYNERNLHDSELAARAAMPAGVRIVFESVTTSVSLHLRDVADETKPVDFVVDGGLVATRAVTDAAGTRASATVVGVENLDPRVKEIEIWLPHFGSVIVEGVTIDDGAEIVSSGARRPFWVTYGSSITQCRTADSPTRTWPARAARALGWCHQNMGYGGQCHLDPLVAFTIRDLDADVISLCLGINVYGGATLSRRTFVPNVIGLVRTIREAKSITPIVVMSPIVSPNRETEPNAVGLTLAEMRDEVHRAASLLRDAGDQNLYTIDGRTVIGAEDAQVMPDGLHPDDAGYALMAERFADRIRGLNLSLPS